MKVCICADISTAELAEAKALKLTLKQTILRYKKDDQRKACMRCIDQMLELLEPDKPEPTTASAQTPVLVRSA